MDRIFGYLRLVFCGEHDYYAVEGEDGESKDGGSAAEVEGAANKLKLRIYDSQTALILFLSDMKQNPEQDWQGNRCGKAGGEEMPAVRHIQNSCNKSNQIQGHEQNDACQCGNLFRGHSFCTGICIFLIMRV